MASDKFRRIGVVPDSPGIAGAAVPGAKTEIGATVELTSGVMPDATWNQTERAYPEVLLHEAIATQVTRTPSAPAVRFRDDTLTYAEFDERVGQLARRLQAEGVAAGSFVGVCMERSLELVVTLHAIFRSGGVYVPIDPEYPDERINFMLEELEGPILLTQERLAKRFADAAASVVPIDGPSAPVLGAGTTELPRVSPDDLAYLIYTSGSTGQPKGVMITHRAIANRLYWMQEYISLLPSDKLLLKTPFSFDVSVPEFFWPLLVGGELVVAEPGGHRDGTYLAQVINERAITTINFVPSMLQLFLEAPTSGDCTSLKRVVCSGEALPKALQDRFFARMDAELYNLYGPTETTVEVSAWKCDPTTKLSFVPIGKAVANTQLHILDGAMRPVAVGEVGELHVGGVQVAPGYLNRPALTAERFVPDPFRTGATLYKTGDLARFLPDGNVEFLGRSDFQVKIRGFRVELGEIENALESCDGVLGAVVVARERPGGELQLVAYVAHPDGDTGRTAELRTSLAERLPEYMIPTTFIWIEQFPLTTSGKVDRKALPAPVRGRPSLASPYVGPRSELERVIVEKWRRILDVDQVGIHDPFFELGGTSLQAARFVNELQTETGASIFVVTLFGAPTAAGYAAYLEREQPSAVASILGIEPGEVAEATDPVAVQPRQSRVSRGSLASQRTRRRATRTPGVG